MTVEAEHGLFGALDVAPDVAPDYERRASPATRRLVEVAVDAAAGPGPRTYTYAASGALADVEPAEVVLVPFGRGGRQAVGVVLGPSRESTPEGAAEIREIVARIRSDGPLVPPLTLSFARWIADHYLAPVSTVLRAMLPPGMLERLEVIAEATPAGEAALGPGAHVDGDTTDETHVAADESRAAGESGAAELDPHELDLLEEIAARPRPVRDLAAGDGRAVLLRRLRSLETAGLIELTPTLVAAAIGPRYERRVRLSDAGVIVARAIHGGDRGGDRPEGRPLGPRQVATLLELFATATAEPGVDGAPASDLVERHGASALAGLVRRGLLDVEVRERPRRPLAARPPGRRGARPPGSMLVPAQRTAVDLAVTAVAAGDPTPLLLDGVTGGGKTAIYLEAIVATLDRGRPVLVLVPEIALALPLVDRLRADLAVRVAVVHSGLSDGERADEWRRIRAGDVDLVVGTRTALLSPLADVGLVIVDEEHEPTYKSDRTPRFQARDGAIQLGRLAGAAVVLGSATPSVESAGLARAGTYRRVELPTRTSGLPPVVDLVDMRAELAAGNRGLLSDALAAAIAELDVASGDQAILVINRRGTASVVLCRDCGHVQACPDCERPLVFHQAGVTLRCHHCGRATPLATRCPACGSPRIRYLGGGTERVEREVRDRYPALRVGRLDRDVVARRGGAERVMDAFAEGRLDVLVGTSLVAKALDVPRVTLVGIVSADVALSLPDERAAERTYQLVAQAVGRAGRGDRLGRAIIQTYRPDHRAIRAVVEDDPRTFYDEELAVRERWSSPPFGRLVRLTVGLADRDAAEAAGVAMASELRERAAAARVDVTVAGPAPAYIARRAERWRFNIVLRGTDPVALLRGGPGPPWSVDVDPESLL
ncbi:MAG: primosomal protein N' [Chloroflexota bacterium]